METITLSGLYGSQLRDEYGNTWTEFTVDTFADQLPGECCICHAELEDGWLCLDGGDEVCDVHIVVSESAYI